MSGTSGMSDLTPPDGRTSVRLVARREIRERLRTKAFRWVTAILIVVSVLGVALPKAFSSDTKATVVRVGATPGRAGGRPLGPQPDRPRRRLVAQGQTVVITYPSEARGRAAVADGTVAFLVTPDRLRAGKKVATDGTPRRPARCWPRRTNCFDCERVSRASACAATRSRRAPAPKPLPVERLTAQKDARHEDQIPFLAAVNVLMYLILVIYGQAVAAGVNEEKSSRVVELLLSSMTPRRLLTGKVVGIGIVGLIQVASMAVAAGATALLVGANLPSGSPATAAAYVVWFALAYALYCTLFAAAGALTSRAEESQQAATPVMILLAVGYLGAFLAFPVTGRRPGHAAVVRPVHRTVGHACSGGHRVGPAGRRRRVDVVDTGRHHRGEPSSGTHLLRRVLLRFGPRVKVRDAFGPTRRSKPRPGADRRSGQVTACGERLTQP